MSKDKKFNLKELAEVFFKVLSDKSPITDATFVHGSCVNNSDLDDNLLVLAVELLNSGKTKLIVINGLISENYKIKFPYPGCEVWRNKLLAFGVKSEKIIILPSSMNTGNEADNLITLSKERGWESMTIVSLPHHILRCMLTHVNHINRQGSNLKIYAKTLDEDILDWFMPAIKESHGIGERVDGILLDHIGAEIKRIGKYMFPDDPNIISIATAQELNLYILNRDKN